MANSNPTFDGGTRWTLMIAGVLFVLVGLGLWVHPVKHTQPAPANAKCPIAAKCVVKVDDTPEILLSTLVVLGGVIFLIGVNNLQLTQFTGPGGTGFATAAPQAGTEAAKKAKQDAVNLKLTPVEQAAAEVLAKEKGKGYTLEAERVYGRPLTRVEVAHTSTLAAADAVQEVQANPNIT